MNLDAYILGKIPFETALEFQYELVDRRRKSQISDTLVLLEHEPVITLGMNANESNILAHTASLRAMGISTARTDRGGDVTYHGPGQVVGYIICNLREAGLRGAGSLINGIEKMFVEYLAMEYGIYSVQHQGRRGVWTDNSKILAIGMNVKGFITMHGFAFNVSPELSHFETIIPCGLSGTQAASLESIKNEKYDIKKIKYQIAYRYAEYFGYEKPCFRNKKEMAGETG